MTPKNLKRQYPDDQCLTSSQTDNHTITTRNVRQRTTPSADDNTQTTPSRAHKGAQEQGVEYLSPAATSSASEADASSSSESESESDDASSLSSSEAEDENEDEDEDEAGASDGPDEDVVTIVPQRARPPFTAAGAGGGASALRSRLDAFLPQLRDANSETERLRREGKIAQIDVVEVAEPVAEGGRVAVTDAAVEDDAGDDEVEGGAEEGQQYVEMDLGLGVLEERRDHTTGTEREDDDEDGDGTGGGAVKPHVKEDDVLGKLMGRSGSKGAPTIQEM